MGIPLGKGLRQYDAKAVSDATAVDPGTEMLTQQHLKEEVDVNNIVRRFGLSELPRWSREGVYGDFTGISDYESAREKIASVDRAFMSLPADIRDRFRNDPAELVRFAESVSEDEFEAAMAPEASSEPAAPAPAAAPVSNPPE